MQRGPGRGGRAGFPTGRPEGILARHPWATLAGFHPRLQGMLQTPKVSPEEGHQMRTEVTGCPHHPPSPRLLRAPGFNRLFL